MDLPGKKLSPSDMWYETVRTKGYLEEYVERGERASKDIERVKRRREGQCRYCFYIAHRAGGSVVTHRPCGLCGVELSYCNTAIDVLCKSCSDKHLLCVHCGADRELRVRRRKWPTKEECGLVGEQEGGSVSGLVEEKKKGGERDE